MNVPSELLEKSASEAAAYLAQVAASRSKQADWLSSLKGHASNLGQQTVGLAGRAVSGLPPEMQEAARNGLLGAGAGAIGGGLMGLTSRRRRNPLNSALAGALGGAALGAGGTMAYRGMQGATTPMSGPDIDALGVKQKADFAQKPYVDQALQAVTGVAPDGEGLGTVASRAAGNTAATAQEYITGKPGYGGVMPSMQSRLGLGAALGLGGAGLGFRDDMRRDYFSAFRDGSDKLKGELDATAKATSKATTGAAQAATASPFVAKTVTPAPQPAAQAAAVRSPVAQPQPVFAGAGLDDAGDFGEAPTSARSRGAAGAGGGATAGGDPLTYYAPNPGHGASGAGAGAGGAAEGAAEAVGPAARLQAVREQAEALAGKYKPWNPWGPGMAQARAGKFLGQQRHVPEVQRAVGMAGEAWKDPSRLTPGQHLRRAGGRLGGGLAAGLALPSLVDWAGSRTGYELPEFTPMQWGGDLHKAIKERVWAPPSYSPPLSGVLPERPAGPPRNTAWQQGGQP